MNNSELSRILSPLLLFVFHVTYLITSSPDPFLKKWLEGSFSFFLALVLCNIIRANVLARQNRSESPETAEHGQDDTQRDSDP
jgi:hypothetical protein